MSCAWCIAVACQMKAFSAAPLSLGDIKGHFGAFFFLTTAYLLLKSHNAHKIHNAPTWAVIARWLQYEALCCRRVLALQYSTKVVLSKTEFLCVASVAALNTPWSTPAHLLQVDIKIKVTASVGAQFKGFKRSHGERVALQNAWQMHCMLKRIYPGSVQAIPIPIRSPTSAKSKNNKIDPREVKRGNVTWIYGWNHSVCVCVSCFLNWKM